MTTDGCYTELDQANPAYDDGDFSNPEKKDLKLLLFKF